MAHLPVQESEIRDHMGGGKGSWPIAGTAVYMTSYPRTEEGREWEEILPVRKWLYQTPEQILIKASNGASDFGNKFGQPLICGSVLTFEHTENKEVYGYDKVIMLAGGIGYGTQRDCLKELLKQEIKLWSSVVITIVSDWVAVLFLQSIQAVTVAVSN